MRELTFTEMGAVAGAERLDVTVIDPVAAAQTFLFLMSVTDQQGFMYGSVITGMSVGAVAGGVAAYGAAGAGALGLAAGLLGAGAGLLVGGVAFKLGASFAIGSYNLIMG